MVKPMKENEIREFVELIVGYSYESYSYCMFYIENNQIKGKAAIFITHNKNIIPAQPKFYDEWSCPEQAPFNLDFLKNQLKLKCQYSIQDDMQKIQKLDMPNIKTDDIRVEILTELEFYEKLKDYRETPEYQKLSELIERIK